MNLNLIKCFIPHSAPNIPIMNKDNILYERPELFGSKSIAILPHKYLQYELLNSTADYILSLVDGKRTIKSICDIAISEYGIAYKQQIEKDISDIFSQWWLKKK